MRRKVVKDFRLDFSVVRTLKAIQEASNSKMGTNETKVVAFLIREEGLRNGLLYKPCPNLQGAQKTEQGLIIFCSMKSSWFLFKDCLECTDWKPTPPTASAWQTG